MKSNLKKLAHPGKLITCIVAKGHAVEIAHALKEKLQIVDFHIHHCRGSGISDSQKSSGLTQEMEKDVLLVNVSSERADEVFEFIYFEAKINEPSSGFMYQSHLQAFTPLLLPDLPEEA